MPRTTASRPARRDTPARPQAPAHRSPDTLLGAPLERVFYVQARLSEGLSTTAKDFMAKWGVSRSTVKRDLQFMRDRLHMPIEWDNTRKTFHFSRPCDTLPALILGPREALTLALAGRMCDAFYGTSFGAHLDGILRKLAPLLGSGVAFAADSLAHVHAPPVDGALDDFEHFLPLLEAIDRRQEVRLHYTKPESDTPEERVVHPLKLVHRRDQRWTVVAHDTDRRELRSFVLGRIESVDTTGRSYTPPAGVDIDAYVRKSMGAFASTKEHEIRLALDTHAAFYARERPWHGSQRLTDRADGRVEMTLRVNHVADVKNAVLRWGEHVEVLAPADLRAEVHATLLSAAARYGRT